MEKTTQELLSIGKILNFHGIKGDVKVGFTEGNEKVLSETGHVYVVSGSETVRLDIESVRFHKKTAIIKFKQFNSVDDTVKFKGCLLKLPKEELISYLEEDEFYISDLIGLKACDTDGNYLGEVSGVVSIKQQDMLFIKNTGKKEYMVPFKKEIVPEVDLEKGKITINVIEGLFEKHEI